MFESDTLAHIEILSESDTLSPIGIMFESDTLSARNEGNPMRRDCNVASAMADSLI